MPILQQKDSVTASALFQQDCRNCPRLAQHLDNVKADYPDYHARPVPPFGAAPAKLLIVGLAPGLHGANRTGRPFTGDFAGILLYQTLHKFGFASHSESIAADDALRLIDCRITNAVKCLPPANKPQPSEIRQCNAFLAAELSEFIAHGGQALLALGTIAHQAVLMALGYKSGDFPFSHGAIHHITEGTRLYDSYHCSRYNTQTKRLTESMFEQVITRICQDVIVTK
jgi:uracil-DNA glycosylase family 4